MNNLTWENLHLAYMDDMLSIEQFNLLVDNLNKIISSDLEDKIPQILLLLDIQLNQAYDRGYADGHFDGKIEGYDGEYEKGLIELNSNEEENINSK